MKHGRKANWAKAAWENYKSWARAYYRALTWGRPVLDIWGEDLAE